MNVQNIFLIGVILFLLYITVSFFATSGGTTTGMTSATTNQTVTIPMNSTTPANSSNNTFAIWFYIDDFVKSNLIANSNLGISSSTYNPTTPAGGSTTYSCLAPSSAGYAGCPTNTSSTLAPFGDPSTASSTQTGILFASKSYITAQIFSDGTLQVLIGSTATNLNLIVINNTPVQKWCQLIITTTNYSADAYLDGKLYSTISLEGQPSCNMSNSIYVTPGKGFVGYTSKFQYLNETINPQTAWNMYSAGYGGSMYSNTFGRYNVQVALLDQEKVQQRKTI